MVRAREHRRRTRARSGLGHHRGGDCGVWNFETQPLGINLVQAAGEPLGEAPRVREHDRRAVLHDAIYHRLFDVWPERVCARDGFFGGCPGSALAQPIGFVQHLGDRWRVGGFGLRRTLGCVASCRRTTTRARGARRHRRRTLHVVDRDDDAQVVGLRRARGNDIDRRGAAQKPGDLVDRAHRRREADALRRGLEQAIEPFEADRKVCAALRGGDGVDLVDDQGAHTAQGLCRLAGEHQIQRLGRGDEDVWRVGEEPAAIVRRGVARAHAHTDLGGRCAEPPRGKADANEG